MRITIASAEAIRYSCMKFHYAKSVPSVQYGFNVYNDNDEWCGTICYGQGANNHISLPFGLVQGQVLELVRVALNGKQKQTSECVAASLRKLHEIAPIIKIIVSYADIDQGHAGTIYQATNWIYLGKKNEGESHAIFVNGKKTHKRTLCSVYGTSVIDEIRKNVDRNAEPFFTKGKHKYIFCFDKKLRKKYLSQAVPYPKKENING